MSINKIESGQRHFTARVNGMEGLDYWDQLKALQIYSQERRRESYRIIFLWNVTQGLMKGYGVTVSESGRRGRLIVPKPVVKSAPAQVRHAKEISLGCTV